MTDKLNLLVLYHRAVQDVTLADKVCNKGVCRLVVDIDRGANLLNFTLTHNHDCIAQSESLLLVVRYIYKGDTERLVHLLQLHLHILAHLQVERSQRLIEQKHLRLIYDGTSDGNTLLLTSRERIYIAVLVVGHRHHLQRFAHTLVNLLRCHLFEFQTEGDILIDIQMRKEGISLENRIKRSLVRRHTQNILILHRDNTPCIGLCKSCQHTEQSRLAATRRSEQSYKLATLDIEVDVVENNLVAERFRQVLDFDNCFTLFCHLYFLRFFRMVCVRLK